MFFEYWKEAGRPEDFINLIKDKSFILYKTNANKERFRGKASDIYFPILDLEKYFEGKSDAKFVDLEEYHSFIKDKEEQQILKEFLLKLGVSVMPRVFEREITDSTIKEKLNLRPSTYGYNDRNKTVDKIIDGCKEAIENISDEKSLILWHFLIKLSNYDYSEGSHRYFYYSQRYQSFETTTLTLLKESRWLLSRDNEFVAPKEITINELADSYKRDTELERLLEFKMIVILTKAERIALKFDSEDDAEEARQLLEEKRNKEKQKAKRRTSNDISEDFDTAIQSIETLSQLIDETIEQKEKTNQLPDFDEDEELAKGLAEIKKQIELKNNRRNLVQDINNYDRYSYDWFKAYLLLLNTYGEKQDKQKQKSISFQEIRPYKSDNKYFLLRGTSSYISPEIENASDFEVALIFGNNKREEIAVEGVSKRGQDLLIYCREAISDNILHRLPSVFKIEINFKPIINLLDRLYNAFTNPMYIDEWQDIKEEMPALNYIYGPPGTGKTTTLCNRINNILLEDPKAKFLVLTPTNKASDVVCGKLQEINPNIYTVRLSKPTDPELEGTDIYIDTLERESLRNINVVATTIHRLPYFEVSGEKDGNAYKYRLFQHQKWDYVIFDESSMTGLHYIVFSILSLYKTNPETTFIISGDPKQIPPVIEIDEKELDNLDFQDENIYKMMELESFDPTKQVLRENDKILNLNTQYRSIPKIGQLFSELSYAGLLKHYRETTNIETKQLPPKLKEIITSKVTFIDIPLNEDNSIYKVNKLFYSSYHTYSALLVAEIIKFFDNENQETEWTIGLIAPYKAQAVLLNRLITSYSISEKIKVYSDTVHGFQGDECDLVFFVCNPNNYNYSGHPKALLSKEYIYNVAISRAKDYLVILHPYSKINDNPYINRIAHSYKNSFGDAPKIRTKEIEKTLFNDESFIENNSYVSGHDNVNVFGLSEMKYFIKSNDTAIDLQLRDLKENDSEDLLENSQPERITTARSRINLKIVDKIDLSQFEKYERKRRK